jgi:hypothetical protein
MAAPPEHMDHDKSKQVDAAQCARARRNSEKSVSWPIFNTN